jgi:hypothetical protein
MSAAQVKRMAESEEIKRRKAEAQEHWAALTQAAGMQSTSSMEIGWEAFYLKSKSLFGALGFEDEHAARIAAGVGESTWYANIRLAEAFQGITKARFTRMKQANAKALADLPESKRLSDEWVRMAASMKIQEFAEKVDKEMNGKAKASDGKERTSSIKVTVPSSRKEVIQDKIKEFAEEHGISADDPGKAIELALVEATGGPTLTSTITTMVQVVKDLKKYLKNTDDSADEQLAKVNEELNRIILLAKEGLESASASNSSKRAA